MMVLYSISVGVRCDIQKYVRCTVWFSNAIQLGTMIEAKVKPVAGVSSVAFCKCKLSVVAYAPYQQEKLTEPH